MSDDLERRLRDFGEALDTAIQSPVRRYDTDQRRVRSPLRVLGAVAAVLAVALVGITAFVAGDADPPSAVEAEAARPILGDTAIWPSSARMSDSAPTATAAVNKFLVALGVSDAVVEDVDAGPSSPVFVPVRVGSVATSLLAVPTQGVWAIHQVGDGLGFTVGENTDSLTGRFTVGHTAEVAWRDNAGMHYRKVTVADGGEVSLGAKPRGIASATVVTREPSGEISGIFGGDYEAPAELPSTSGSGCSEVQADGAHLDVTVLRQPLCLVVKVEHTRLEATLFEQRQALGGVSSDLCDPSENDEGVTALTVELASGRKVLFGSAPRDAATVRGRTTEGPFEALTLPKVGDSWRTFFVTAMAGQFMPPLTSDGSATSPLDRCS